MNASKETAARAKLIVIRQCGGAELTEADSKYLLDFFSACEKKLPSEAAYARAKGCQKMDVRAE